MNFLKTWGQIFSSTKVDFSLTYIFLNQTHWSMKHVAQLHNTDNVFVHSVITDVCAIIKLLYSVVILQCEENNNNWGRKAQRTIFLQTKDPISVKPYSVDEFFDVEMANHQQWEAVPLFNRHGAEGLEDDLIRLGPVCGCCGLAVTQVDKPGQDLCESIQGVGI